MKLVNLNCSSSLHTTWVT